MKKLALDLLTSVGLYVLLVVGGVVCFLMLAPVVGYLPYSDRPGPGWVGQFPGLTWTEFWAGFEFFIGWAVLLVPYMVVAGVLLFAVARILEHLHTPRIAVAVVAALVAGFVSGYLVAGIGWYIAIGAPAVYVAMLLGVLFGSVLLPRRALARKHGV